MFSQGSRYRFLGRDMSMGLQHNGIYELHIDIWPQEKGGAIATEIRNMLGQVSWRYSYANVANFSKDWVKI